jgi:hypothetical protein
MSFYTNQSLKPAHLRYLNKFWDKLLDDGGLSEVCRTIANLLTIEINEECDKVALQGHNTMTIKLPLSQTLDKHPYVQQMSKPQTRTLYKQHIGFIVVEFLKNDFSTFDCCWVHPIQDDDKTMTIMVTLKW